LATQPTQSLAHNPKVYNTQTGFGIGKNIFLRGLVAISLAALALDSGQVKALVVSVGGTNYYVTTFIGNPLNDGAKFKTPANGGTMPWWGDEALALQFATAVGNALGQLNGPNIPINGGIYSPPNTVTGPFFATLAGELVYAAFFNFSASQVQSFTDFDFSVNYTYAEVLPPSPAVPGPLPLFGAAAAFGMSRRLRRRIQLGG
jgi:hypothetical protein